MTIHWYLWVSPRNELLMNYMKSSPAPSAVALVGGFFAYLDERWELLYTQIRNKDKKLQLLWNTGPLQY